VARTSALACASHQGPRSHTDRVARLAGSYRAAKSDDFRCGPQEPADNSLRAMRLHSGRRSGTVSESINNCSGKHAGFLTLTVTCAVGTDYVDPTTPVQRAFWPLRRSRRSQKRPAPVSASTAVRPRTRTSAAWKWPARWRFCRSNGPGAQPSTALRPFWCRAHDGHPDWLAEKGAPPA